MGRLAWAVIRFPVFTLLVILEPVVRLLLAGTALLVILAAVFYACLRPALPVPILGMLLLAVVLFGLLALYHALLRVLRA